MWHSKSYSKQTESNNSHVVVHNQRYDDEPYNSVIPRDAGRDQVVLNIGALQNLYIEAMLYAKPPEPYNPMAFPSYGDQYVNLFDGRMKLVFDFLRQRLCSKHLTYDEYTHYREYISALKHNVNSKVYPKDFEFWAWVEKV